MKIAFRVDASFQIGTGHVMRCLTLGKALREWGADCKFICQQHEGNLKDRIQNEGFQVTALLHTSKANTSKANTSKANTSKANTSKASDGHIDAHTDSEKGTDWQTDAQQTIDALADELVDWLIIDHYELDTRWETQLRPHAKKIMVIDDLDDRSHNCDLLLDQNLVADLELRYDGRVPSHCVRLLGPQYALLQPEYAEFHMRTPWRLGPVRRILISFGGADLPNLTGLALAAFLSLQRKDIKLDVVINPLGPHAAAIRTQARDHANITVHAMLPNLASLMLKADLALGAAGVTSWERCCLGLPSLVITLAENQKPIAAALDQKGLVRWLGHFDTVTEQALKQSLQATIEDSGLEEWSLNCRALVDGKGVERVAAVMTLDGNTLFKARMVRLDDEAILLKWANDSLVRLNAFNPETISDEVHRSWFFSRLREPERCKLYIVETEGGLPIGQVRFEFTDAGWEIDYSVDRSARGRKLGRRVLEVAMLEFRRTEPRALLFGLVKICNKPSQRVFEELGFTSSSACKGLVYRNML